MVARHLTMEIALTLFAAGKGGRSLPVALLLAGLLGAKALACDPQALAASPGLESSQTTLTIRSDSQAKEKNIYRLQGHIVVTYQSWKLTADQATYDETSGEIVARGHVTFTDPQASLQADEAHYDVRTGKGWFKNGRGYFHAAVRPRPRLLTTPDPFFVQARRVERVDPSTYLVQNGHLTTCPNPDTGWAFSAHTARVAVGEEVVTRGAVFHLLRIPVMYSPLFINSIEPRRRQAGFLLPQIGDSGQKGFILSEGFYLPFNPSADLLLGLDNYSRRGVGGSVRFRARPSESSGLEVNFFGVNDRGLGNDPSLRAPGQSWQVQGHADDLGHGFRGVADVDYLSSLAFRQTFTNNFTQAVTSEVHQTGFLSKSFGADSLDFYASRYQNFLSAERKPGNSIIIEHAPTVSFSGMDRQIGRWPFYFSFDASAGGVRRIEPALQDLSFTDRLDFHPTLTLRSRPFWGFHFTPSVGVRATHYGSSLRADRSPLTRLLGDFSADLRPPSFAKVFSGIMWGHRIKHVIEPDIRYDLVRVRHRRDIMDIVRYDQTDILTETNEIEYSLTNTILTRKASPGDEGEAPPARELISWRVSQKYYFDPTFGGALQPGKETVFGPTVSLTGFAFARGQRLSPLVSVLKIAPSSNYDTELRADFSPSGGGVLNAGITSQIRRGVMGLAVTDFLINRTAALNQAVAPTTALSQIPSFNLLRIVGTYGDVQRKGLSGAFGLDYNFGQGIAQQVVSQVSYNFCCFSLDFEYQRFALGPLRRENQFRVALSLANVGTFGNLRPRERLF